MIRSSWPSVSRIWRSRASLSWKSRSSASSRLRRCSSFAISSSTSVSALLSWASFRSLWVSRIWSRICSSRENFRASRSREAFSGSRPAKRLGEPEHPLLQLGHLGGDVLLGEADRVAVGDGRFLGSSAFLSSVFLSSSKTEAALSASFFAWASAGRAMTAPAMTTKRTKPGDRSQAVMSAMACHRKPPACETPGLSRAASTNIPLDLDHLGRRISTTAQPSYFRRRRESIAREFRDDSPEDHSGIDHSAVSHVPASRRPPRARALFTRRFRKNRQEPHP